MLILSRRPGESIRIGDDVMITVISISGNQIRLGIRAPREIRVLREEIYHAMQEENRAAASAPEARRRLEDVLQRVRNDRNEDSKNES
jgi:carbon storage regulator